MHRLAHLAPLLALVGCVGKPCNLSSECGGGEVCAASRCQALSCESTWTAVNPADGTCRPLPGCGNPDATREWLSCADPCPSMGEWDCVADRRCQPTYNFERRFQSCHANPLPLDGCAGLTREACDAEPFCVAVGFEIDCNCELGGGCEKCEHFECQPRACSEMHENECGQNPRCISDPHLTNSPFDLGFGAPTFDAGAPSEFPTRGEPFSSCAELHFIPCFALSPRDCRRRADCHPVDGEDFQGCEPDDGLRRCDDSGQCAAGERCNSDEPCTGPGVPQARATELFGFACHSVCVPAGCPGFGEERCDQDPSCEPVYTLQCSPYGGGGGLAPDGSCEPSFIACSDGPRGPVVNPGRSVLCREPEVVDHVAFAFPTVMARLAGGNGVAALVDGWLAQFGADQRVGDRVAQKRPLAASYLAATAQISDGHFDVGRLGFQVTSLSNRIDLAGPNDCGEARITYALAGGVLDRFHRMTVIVELRQPDDGTRCQATAQKWLALSSLEGAALRDALIAIYDPLLAPSSLNQVRTNEFLVGKPDFNSRKLLPWELREWRLGGDGLLHLAPSKQALDPLMLGTAPWNDWLALNRDSVVRSAALLPDAFLAVASSEDGARLPIDDPEVDRALNKMACAGCHTTESNTAFTHVGERYQGRGRAQISEMLLKELPRRARMLEELATGRRRTLDARIVAALTH